MTKAATTVPTPPRVTRSRKHSGATGDVPNTKDNEDRIDTENDDEKKIAGDKNPTGTEDVLGESNKAQSDGADKGDDKKQSDNNQDQDPKSKTTSAAKSIHHETEPEIDGSGKSSDESSLSSNRSRKSKAFNKGELYIVFSCSYFDSNKYSFFADETRKFPKELVEKVRLHL